MRTYPVHESQIQSHAEGGASEVDAFWQVCQQLMIKRLHPVCVSTLDAYILCNACTLYMHICTYSTEVFSISIYICCF